MAILTTGNSYSDGNQITSSNLNAVVNSATFDDPVDISSGLNLTADSPPKIAINTSLSNKILTGGSLNNCPIGAVTASTGAFTTLSASGDISVDGSVKQSGNTGNLTLKGGDTDGANIELYGSNHLTESIRNNAYYDAGVHVFRPVDGSSSSVVITSDGEVGIGATGPTSLLSLEKDDQLGISLTRTGAFPSVCELENSGNNLVVSNNANGIDFQTGATPTSRVFIDSSGDVGIGTTTPNAKLQIKTSASEVEGISVLNAGNTSEIFKVIEDGSNGGYVDIRNSSNTSIIRLNSSGDSYFNADNVGIGTASPSNTLHVENTTSSGAYINYDGQSNTEFGLRIESNADGGDFESDFVFGGTALLDLYANSATVTGGDILVARTQSATPVMLVKGNGNVGIGTATPQHKLDIRAESDAAISTGLLIANTASSSEGTGTEIRMVHSTSQTSNSASTISSERAASNGSIIGLNLSTDGSAAPSRVMTLLGADGNVGIGTETPSHTLDVNSGAINQVALFESTDETAYIELADSTGSVQFITYSSGALRIATGGAGAGSVGTSALFIDQSQNVGIGDDTPSFKLDVNGTGRFVGQLTLDDEVLHNISGTQARLPGYYAGTYGVEIEQTAQGSTVHIGRSNGNCMNIGADAPASPTQLAVVYFRDTSTGIGSSPQASNPVGNISITDSTIHFNSTSDYRLKENEVDITDGIDRLKELKPYRFNFTRNPSKVVDGFFAHEVSPVVPESISGEKDQVDDEGNPIYQGIDQSKLVPLLTAALQEAVAKIEALEARVQTLEG